MIGNVSTYVNTNKDTKKIKENKIMKSLRIKTNNSKEFLPKFSYSTTNSRTERLFKKVFFPIVNYNERNLSINK